ncbi:pseudaminic acid synthase [Paenibacillus sepulcri]|uniref:Pseudaminic acid synthase n=1 Tax=Paenibacillus sepulcri TaxID=359917 RepID=A0ABS7C7C3_9BACL|nr:pseudaminic acid synthase [Paenibacillus sepulcri]
MNEIMIAGRKIGSAAEPFIIAEMSGNHNQSLDRALQIVEQAAMSGAHALKLQTYTADTMTLNIHSGQFHINDKASLWNGQSLYDLYNQAYTPWEWHQAIFEYGRKLGLIVFSSPFDETAVDFLETLGAPCYKIASFENTDLPLIRKAASTGKPVIISTGMATVSELHEAVTACREAGSGQIILLKCTSAYPAPVDHCNIATIPHMRQLFDCPVGLSDHTLGMGVAIASITMGASVIEKHFTLSRQEGGVDSAFSMEPAEMKLLVEEADKAWRAMGKIAYGPDEAQQASLQFRRSLYAAADIKKGEAFTRQNTRIIRPGYGLPPKYYELILDSRAVADIDEGTPLSWDLIIGG